MEGCILDEGDMGWIPVLPQHKRAASIKNACHTFATSHAEVQLESKGFCYTYPHDTYGWQSQSAAVELADYKKGEQESVDHYDGLYDSVQGKLQA